MKKSIKKVSTIMATLFITLLFFNGCSASDSGSKNSDKKLKDFSVGYLPSTGHLLFFVAKEEGFFKEEGLNVNLVKFDSNTDMLSSFISGKLDGGALGSTETVHYLQKGYKLTCIGGVMTEGHALLVKKKVVEGATPKEDGSYDINLLKGKNIAVVPDGTQDIVLRIALKQAGLTDKDVHFINEDSGTSAYAALNNDQIDGAYVFAPFRQMGVDAGYEIFQYSGNVKGLESHPCCRNLVPTDRLKKDKDAYVAYLRALIKAYRFYQENKDETVNDIVKYVQLDKKLIYEETYGKHISSNPDPELKSIKAWYDAMIDLKYIDKFDLDSKVNTKIYKEALDSIVKENPDDEIYKSLEAHYEKYD